MITYRICQTKPPGAFGIKNASSPLGKNTRINGLATTTSKTRLIISRIPAPFVILVENKKNTINPTKVL